MRSLNTIGSYFKTVRLEKRLTQDEVATKAGLSRTYVVALEGGRVAHPQYGTRAKLHEVLGTSDSEIEGFGLLAIDEYGNEWIPDPPPAPLKPERTTESRTEKERVFVVVGAGISEVDNAPEKRKQLAGLLTSFELTQDRYDALLTILRAFAAEDHAPEGWDMPDDDGVPF